MIKTVLQEANFDQEETVILLARLAELPVRIRVTSALLDVKTIYHEEGIEAFARGQEVLTRFPDATRIIVPSHLRIPELSEDSGRIKDWISTKRTTLVLGVKKTLKCAPYERSCDFVAPSQSNGCAMSCAYCYVARRKGFANPVTVFVNIEQICATISKHAESQGMKLTPTQADEDDHVYELGTNSDCAADALISNNLKDMVSLFRRVPNAKGTFATKYVNRTLLDYDPQRKTRIRFSLMPQKISRRVDIRTSPISARIDAINDFVGAGWEVNVNFAPVIVYDGWLEDYAELFEEVEAKLNPKSKAQMSAEIAFLTHNADLHEINMQWHPKGEKLLWRPDLQETKISGTGGENLRYRLSIKRGFVEQFTTLLQEKMPWCRIRYAF